MKIVLEFDTLEEHDAYVAARSLPTADDAKYSAPDAGSLTTRIPITTRRRKFADMEIAFIKENYQHKKIGWIAKALHRKPTQVYQLLFKMYKNGLPRKRSSNGKVSVS